MIGKTLVVLLVLAAGVASQHLPGEVADYTKIGATSGGFTGPLDDNDFFAMSLAALGDLDGNGTNDLAVGASGDDDGATTYGDVGAVWILFMEPDGSVGAHSKISATEGGFTGELSDGFGFGSAVGAVGDLDGNGVSELAVRTRDADYNDVVWILFLDAAGSVLGQTKIAEGFGGFLGPLDANDAFGEALAGIGDLDGDGVPDLAVGDPRDDSYVPFTDTGAVHILFLESDGTVKKQSKITALQGGFTGDISGKDYFGTSVSPLGDLDGDGVVDLAVGAWGDDGTGEDRGAVWILFMESTGTVKDHWKISGPPPPGPCDDFHGKFFCGALFGTAVAGPGDIDGDGVPDLAVGVTGDDDGGTSAFHDAGAVYVYMLHPNGREKFRSKISSTAGGFGGALDFYDYFGNSLAALGDLGGDGIPDLAVGAPFDDDGGVGSSADLGATWVLDLTDGHWMDLGQGLAGAVGDPLLEGSGSMLAGAPTTLSLTNAAANSPAWLIIGVALLEVPFKGGTLVPDVGPPGFSVLLFTDPAGSIEMSASWPSGIPSSLQLALQYWIADAAGPQGFAASNAILTTVP